MGKLLVVVCLLLVNQYSLMIWLVVHDNDLLTNNSGDSRS